MYDIIPIKIAEHYNMGARVFYLGDCEERFKMFNYFWLLKGNNDVVLVDTGFENKEMPGIIQKEDEKPLRQLEINGIKPEDVSKIILTHLHYDHFSSVVFNFPYAEIIVQEKELRYVTNPPHQWFRKFVDIEAVEKLLETKGFTTVCGDVGINDGIEVILTGGHTPGHQAVIVNTKEGNVIITGDLIFLYENLTSDTAIGFNSNLEECLAAMKRIRDLGLKVLPGHDPEVFSHYHKTV